LFALVDFERCKPAADPYDKMNQFYYWSSNRFNHKSGYIWCVDFTDGHIDFECETHKCYVKYVRDFVPATLDKIYERLEFLRKENLKLKQSDIDKISLFQFWKMFYNMPDEFDINNISLTPSGRIHAYLNNKTVVLFSGERNA
jgi:hypothetical protein